MELCAQLFRREAGRMVSVLAHVFGLRNLALAEDVVQDAFRRALETWPRTGPPRDPAAWIMATAKNRALDVLRRERTARQKESEVGWMMESEWTLAPMLEENFSEAAIQDDQLRMMFTCCHPQLAEEAQVALVLNLLCGFRVGEIAAAYLSRPAAIEKRLGRAKRTLMGARRLFDFPPAEVAGRLAAVQRALYLLFNEGYHGASAEAAVRTELCAEAMRLAALLTDDARTAVPSTRALAALMCFNRARLPARFDGAGELTSLYRQDRSRWNQRLIRQGCQLLADSAQGSELTTYHLEAAIASLHSAASGPETTNWTEIVELYEALLSMNPSPVVALNRAIAIGELRGPEAGLRELRTASSECLAAYPFYSAALGEFELRAERPAAARLHFRSAQSLARSPAERTFFARRVADCGPP